MTETLDAPADSVASSVDDQSTRPRKRRAFPRFSLRLLLVLLVVFSLVSAWVGRNLYRIRQEEAAIEALKQAGAVLLLKAGDGMSRHPATPEPPKAPPSPNMPIPEGTPRSRARIEVEDDWYGRLLGYAERPAIRHVNLKGEDPDDEKLAEALKALSVLGEVESVNLNGAAFGDASLPHLAKVAGLEAIGLYQTAVTADGLATLGPPAELTRIVLNPGASPGLASGLPKLTELRSVSLSGLPMGGPLPTRPDIEAVASLPNLEELDLMYLPSKEPEFLAPLSQAKSLRSLRIMGVPFDDAGLSAIGSLPALESLTIGGLSDDGIETLGRIPSLRRIELGPPATADGAIAFSKAHPECLVSYATFSPDGRWYQAGEEVEMPEDERRRREGPEN